MRPLTIAWVLAALLSAGAAAAAPLEPPAVAARRAVPPKPAGPIGVDVRLNAEPVLGVPVTVTITARAETISDLTLEARAADPGALAIGAASLPVDRGGARSWSLTVVPLRATGGYLSVVVAGQIDGVAEARSVVIPVRPAGSAPEVRAPAAAPAAGSRENLSVLPVEERF